MNIREKMSKFAQIEEEIARMEENLHGLRVERERINQEIHQYNSQLTALVDAAKRKRSGIIWLIVGVLLIVAELLLVTGVAGDAYTAVEAIDFVIIGIPLIIGIVKLFKARKADVDLSEQEVRTAISKLEEKCPDDSIKNMENAIKQLESQLMYHGKKWDLSTFYGSAAEVSSLENDFVDLLIALKYNLHDDNFLCNCWISTNVLEQVCLMAENNQAALERFNRGSKAIVESKSWILMIHNAMSGCLMTKLTIAMLRSHGKGITLPELLENMKVRHPQTEDEQALWDLAHEITPRLVATVHRAMTM